MQWATSLAEKLNKAVKRVYPNMFLDLILLNQQSDHKFFLLRWKLWNMCAITVQQWINETLQMPPISQWLRLGWITLELLSGGEMLVRALADEGVEHVFGYPGGAVLHIYDAFFQQDKINHYLVRHEQAAGHMADAYSRVTGKTGVVLVTSGPGATNTVTSIAPAYMDSIPMCILSGHVASHLIG